MKKTITKMFAVAGLVAGTVLSVNAQVSKGSMMFGGSLGANITMESTAKTTGAPVAIADVKTPGHTNWNFSPTVGYFVADGLAVGLALNVGSTFNKTVTTTDGKTNENVSTSNMGVALFARKYMEVSDKVYLHGQASLIYFSQSSTDRVADGLDKLKDGTKTTGTGIGVELTPGITYFVAPKWGIDFSLNNILGYTMTTAKAELSGISSETTGGTFNIGAGLTPSLGLFYYMGN